jgi:hypothetical protein
MNDPGYDCDPIRIFQFLYLNDRPSPTASLKM